MLRKTWEKPEKGSLQVKVVGGRTITTRGRYSKEKNMYYAGRKRKEGGKFRSECNNAPIAKKKVMGKNFWCKTLN